MIIVLAPYVPHPPSHGGCIRSRVLLDALVAEHDVLLAAPVATAAERSNAAILADELGITVEALPAQPGAAHRAGSVVGKASQWLRGRSEMLARRWHPDAAGRVAELLRQPFDLAIADSSFVLPLVPADTAPWMLYLHNIESAIFGRRDDPPRPLRERCTRRLEAWAMAREERRAMQRAAVTVTVSDSDRELAQRLAPATEVVMVPNSVDLLRLPQQAPATAGPPRLLFVGGLDYPPNLEAATELVDVHLPALRAAFPGLRVRLVGRDDNNVGARFAGREGVEVIGPVDDLLPHYRASHAAYLPIRSGGGTRIKILEAWAVGLPVLATSVASEGLLGEDGVHLRRFETVEQGAVALQEVLGGGAAALVAAGRALVESHYSHSAAIAELREITRSVLARGGREHGSS